MQRIRCSRNGFNAIKCHKWFDGIDWKRNCIAKNCCSIESVTNSTKCKL